jgi:Tat protein secretion system quality control protein TatD with DNase activity
VAEALGRVKGLPVAAIAEATTANFERLFGVQVPRLGAPEAQA